MNSNIRSGYQEWRRLGMQLRPGIFNFWTKARMVFAEVPVDENVVREWLPFPLRLARPATATVFIADYPQTTFGSVYHEAAILLHVKFFGIPLVYCPWMIVDDDRALILGREMLGYPKKMGRFRFEESHGKFLGTVERNGKEVFRIEGGIGPAPLASPAPGIGRWAVNLRCLLSLLPGHLLLFRPRETVHQAAPMDARVTLTTADDDPIGIVTGAARNATIRTCDIGTKAFPPPLRVWPVGPFFIAKLMRLRVR